MKTSPELLQKRWDSIKYKDGGFLQIDTQHPLEWHIGFQSINQKTLLLVCHTEIDTVDSSKSMSVYRRKRESDNRWTLSFELLRSEQESVFSIFCSDIIEYSRTSFNEKEALALVIKRYKQWIRLLENQKNSLMDDARRKGLLGELLFLYEKLKECKDAMSILQSWVGVEGADQDFIFPDTWYEIKSIGVSTSSVKISSLEQLDSDPEGELVIMRIDKTAPEKSGAISLNDVVLQIKDFLLKETKALELFQAKLDTCGYIDLQEYSVQKYYFSGSHRYKVNESFPKISKNNVPIQVISLHYELDIPSIENWLVR